jgi:hypothetical protein
LLNEAQHEYQRDVVATEQPLQCDLHVVLSLLRELVRGIAGIDFCGEFLRECVCAMKAELARFVVDISVRCRL